MKCILYGLGAFLISGAAMGQEPPPCSDPGVTATVQELFWEQKLRLQTSPTEADGNAWRAFNDFRVHDVVSIGYDNGLKRRTCEGSIGKGKTPIRVPYTAQLVEGSAGRYVVKADFSAMPNTQAMALRELIVNIINPAGR